ncbi:MAG: mannose-1-phosphate guanylyltransferase [Planctomycetota bacterium]
MRHAMIMAGGSGTRLWPLSRSQRPKQLLPLLPGGRSLLELSVDRIKPLVPDDDRRWICTNADFHNLIVDQIGFRPDRILGEPMGRDTLNAVAFSAAVIAKHDPEGMMAVLTADHVIEPVDRFVECMRTGFELVESNPETLVTFSIVPDHPATGFGYIERGSKVNYAGSANAAADAFTVKRYVEKPDLKTAEEYLAAGTFGWSSGMFIFPVQAMLKAIEKYQPECMEGIRKIQEAWDTSDSTAARIAAGDAPPGGESGQGALNSIYPTLPKISIDYAIMEPASRDHEIPVATVPMDLSWLDVGSWPSYAEIVDADATGNRVSVIEDRDRPSAAVNESGAADLTPVLEGCENVLAVSSLQGHQLALIGCSDLIVVQTADATLICPRDQAQAIKDFLKSRVPEQLH